MRKPLFLAVMILIMLACAVPGAPAVAPLPTFDSNSLQTFIVQTAEAAQTQTALVMPTFTKTPTTTFTPSITPSSTPTFIFKLSTPTPIPTYTIPPTIGTLKSPVPESASGDDEENTDGDKPKNKDEDPRKMSGKDWTCVWYGLNPPRNTIFKPKTHFTVQWMLFNSGNQSWPRTGVDLVYTGGYRHEETKIQDFAQSVAPGKEIWVRASFIAPKAAGDYATYFTLMVGKRKFCPLAYFFTVEE